MGYHSRIIGLSEPPRKGGEQLGRRCSSFQASLSTRGDNIKLQDRKQLCKTGSSSRAFLELLSVKMAGTTGNLKEVRAVMQMRKMVLPKKKALRIFMFRCVDS